MRASLSGTGRSPANIHRGPPTRRSLPWLEISEGILDPEKEVFCPGDYRLGRHTYRCWKPGGHGDVNLDQAVLGSCDVYFYQLGVRTRGRYDRPQCEGIRLGPVPTGIEVQSEMSGLVPSREWKERARGERWLKGETVSASIGQGFNLVTPIQLAQVFAILGNGGTIHRPHFIKHLEAWDGTARHYPERDAPKPTALDPAAIERGCARVSWRLCSIPRAPARGPG